MKKRSYLEPRLDFVRLDEQDVVSTSDETDEIKNPGGGWTPFY